jgi:hypothetical protein
VAKRSSDPEPEVDQPAVYLTPVDLAARWRISRSAVHRVADSGRLRTFRVTGPGGAVRFEIGDVIEYERRFKTGGSPPS